MSLISVFPILFFFLLDAPETRLLFIRGITGINLKGVMVQTSGSQRVYRGALVHPKVCVGAPQSILENVSKYEKKMYCYHIIPFPYENSAHFVTALY